VNVLLLFWVLVRATGYLGRSGMVAALFALHPVNVESVAWIAERKNLLSLLFFLLALAAYRRYVERPRRTRYSAVLLCFALGLMAKPQIVTLPFVLLLWDYWPLRRVVIAGEPFSMYSPKIWRQLVIEKLPLFLLSALSSIVTLRAQQVGGSVASLDTYPFVLRVENALICYMRYIGKLFWPSRLAIMYPHPGMALSRWEAGPALVLLLSITAFVMAHRSRRYLLVGWLWFLGTLVPMIGIVQVGHQGMADRYAYLPFIGLFLMLCWGVPDFVENRPLVPRSVNPYSLAGAALIVLLALALITHRQLGYWRDNIGLWSHAEGAIAPSAFFENRIGDELLRRGEPEAALQHFERAVQFRPSDYDSNFAIAVYRQKTGDLSAAVERYRMVLDSPAPAAMKARALTYMSYAYRAQGDTRRERESLDAAERLQR
jgi:tetratricopeptide (TPR) repeat protein